MSSQKEEIIQVAEQLFLQRGVRGVTMDDISRQLGISKKTIYLHYKDKDDVVNTVTERYLQRETSRIQELKQHADHAIHELILESNYIREHMHHVNPMVIEELQRYHRTAWKIYLHFRDHMLFNMIEQTLRKGIDEGYFRPDIDVRVLGVLRVEECQMMLNTYPYARETFDFYKVEAQLMEHYMRGILTPKGFSVYKQYLQN